MGNVKLDYNKIQYLYNIGYSVDDIVDKTGICRAAIYNNIKIRSKKPNKEVIQEIIKLRKVDQLSFSEISKKVDLSYHKTRRIFMEYV